MGMRRVIVVCSLGDREHYVRPLIKNLRKYWDGTIIVITDQPIENLDAKLCPAIGLEWRTHPRWGVRNCNLQLARAALWEGYDSVCCLNDDMRVVSKAFVDGFALAEKFGVCVPMNPRIYVKYNAMGADTTEEDRKETDKGPIYGPACNVSPMFACRLHDHARLLLETYVEELHNCMRGTLAFWLASYRCAVTPLYLPEQWCVCGSSAKFIRDYKKPLQGKTRSIEPVMLHWGQAEVREVFKGVYDGLD